MCCGAAQSMSQRAHLMHQLNQIEKLLPPPGGHWLNKNDHKSFSAKWITTMLLQRTRDTCVRNIAWLISAFKSWCHQSCVIPCRNFNRITGQEFVEVYARYAVYIFSFSELKVDNVHPHWSRDTGSSKNCGSHAAHAAATLVHGSGVRRAMVLFGMTVQNRRIYSSVNSVGTAYLGFNP